MSITSTACAKLGVRASLGCIPAVSAVVDSLRAPIVKGSSSRIQYWTSAIKDLTTINLRKLPVKGSLCELPVAFFGIRAVALHQCRAAKTDR
jgi:hypothetical protein